MKPGPIALVGSGEYLPVMAEIEAQLIAGRGNKYVQIPTAAAPEGEKSLNYWKQLGIDQANRINATAVPLLIKDSQDANDDHFVKQIDGAGLIYFSGGNPHFLAQTLHNSRIWSAIYQAWQNGAALAGCSAGAMAIANHIPGIKNLSKKSTPGLAVLPNVRVLPHFDRAYMSVFHRYQNLESGIVLGIDENTALVGGLTEWEVKGKGSVWVFKSGQKQQYFAGAKIEINP